MLGCQSRLGVRGLPSSVLVYPGRRDRGSSSAFAIHVFGTSGEDGDERGVGAEGVEAGPGFGGCASPGRVDEADGDVLLFVFEDFLEVAGEEVGDGGEVAGGVGSAEGPACGGLDVFERVVGAVSLDEEEADVGIVGGGDLFFGVFDLGFGSEAGEGHLHVGLAGGEPEIAEEDVFVGDGVGAADGEGVGSAGGLRREVEAPAAGGRWWWCW